ncbi:hypothetical protein EJB05_37251, partial [Eragrostis curvula]
MVSPSASLPSSRRSRSGPVFRFSPPSSWRALLQAARVPGREKRSTPPFIHGKESSPVSFSPASSTPD